MAEREITGTVCDSTRTPIPGVAVTLTPEPLSDFNVAIFDGTDDAKKTLLPQTIGTKTDADGEFTIKFAPPDDIVGDKLPYRISLGDGRSWVVDALKDRDYKLWELIELADTGGSGKVTDQTLVDLRIRALVEEYALKSETTVVPITRGGTGASDAAGARANLGVGSGGGGGLAKITALDTTTVGIYYVQGGASTTGTAPSFAPTGYDYAVIVYETSASNNNIQQVAFELNNTTFGNRWESREYNATFSAWGDWFPVNDRSAVYDRVDRGSGTRKTTITGVTGFLVPSNVTVFDVVDAASKGPDNEIVDVFLPFENIIDGHDVLIRNLTSQTKALSVRFNTVTTNGNATTTIPYFTERSETAAFRLAQGEELHLIKAGTRTIGSSPALTIPDWREYNYKDRGAGGGSTPGTAGTNGWSPVFALPNRGTDIVVQIADWVGGSGTKPSAPVYVTTTGLSNDVRNAINVRGPKGDKGDDGSDATVTQAAVYTQNKAILQAGTNVSLSPNDGSNTITVNATGGGSAGSGSLQGRLVATAPITIPAEGAFTKPVWTAASTIHTARDAESRVAFGEQVFPDTGANDLYFYTARDTATRARLGYLFQVWHPGTSTVSGEAMWLPGRNGRRLTLGFHWTDFSTGGAGTDRSARILITPSIEVENKADKITWNLGPVRDAGWVTQSFVIRVYAVEVQGDKGDKGDPGTPGAAGRDGRDGSDASVNRANVYTQARAILRGGTNVSLSPDDDADTLTINAVAGGSTDPGNLQGRLVATAPITIPASGSVTKPVWTAAGTIHTARDAESRVAFGEQVFSNDLYFYKARDTATRARLGYLFQVWHAGTSTVASEAVWVPGHNQPLTLGFHWTDFSTGGAGTDRSARMLITPTSAVEDKADRIDWASTATREAGWVSQGFTVRCYAVEVKGEKGDTGAQGEPGPKGDPGGGGSGGGNSRGRLLATSNALATAQTAGNTEYTVTWTINQAGVLSPFVPDPRLPERHKLVVPNTRWVDDLIGLWMAAEVDGTLVSEEFYPMGPSGTLSETAYLALRTSALQQIRVLYNSQLGSAEIPGEGRDLIILTSAGTSQPANTVVKIYEALGAGGGGSATPPAVTAVAALAGTGTTTIPAGWIGTYRAINVTVTDTAGKRTLTLPATSVGNVGDKIFLLATLNARATSASGASDAAASLEISVPTGLSLDAFTSNGAAVITAASTLEVGKADAGLEDNRDRGENQNSTSQAWTLTKTAAAKWQLLPGLVF